MFLFNSNNNETLSLAVMLLWESNKGSADRFWSLLTDSFLYFCNKRQVIELFFNFHVYCQGLY